MKIDLRLLLLAALISIAGCGKKDTAITSVEMLRGGRTIAVPSGTVADKLVLGSIPDARIKYFNNILDCALAVKSGKADAACYDLPVLSNIASKNDGVRLLPELLLDDHYGFAFRPGETSLKNTADSVLIMMKKEGIYDDMMKRWFPAKGSPGPLPGIASTTQEGVLRFGTSAVTEPMAYFDAERNITGFDIEYASYIAKALNRKLEITDMEFGALIPALIAGKVDMIGAGLSITEERAKKVLFSESYYKGGIAVLVGRQPDSKAGNKLKKFKSPDDLDGCRLGVLLGTAFDEYAQKNFTKARLFQYPTQSDLFTALVTEKVDVILLGNLQVGQILKKNKGVSVFYDNVFEAPLCIGLNKDSTELKNKFNAFLSEIKANGTLDEITERWYREDNPVMPEIKTAGGRGILRAAVDCTIGLPRSAIINGTPAGFDVEVSKRFAAYLGRDYEPVELPLSGMLASLRSGKIDMVANLLLVTEDRKKQIAFTSPVSASGACLLALDKNIDQQVFKKLKGVSDISDKRIGVLLGSIHDNFARRDFPKAEILQFQNLPDIVTALKADKVDVAFSDHITLKDIFDRNPELDVLAANLYTVPIAAAFNKNNRELRDKFNTFLGVIRANGIYDDMVDRWMNKGEDAMPVIPGSEGKETLRVGIISDGGLPSATLKDGKLTGFDIELPMRFAAYMGMRFEPVDIPFGSMLASLSTGKIDMVTCQLMITEERKKQVDFSDPYYESGISLFVKKDRLADVSGINGSENSNARENKSFLESVSESFYNNLILEKRYLLILNGLLLTILISVFSAITGTVIGGLVCFLRMSQNKALSLTGKLYIALLRGTPVLVLLMIIFYVVFRSVNISPPLVAVIAFGLNFGAYVSEMFRASIESIDKGQKEAGIALGFTKVQTFINIIMPQALRQVLPVYKGEFISLVKMTSIVGYIAVQDLTKASDIIRSRTFDAFFPLLMAALIYLLLSWLLTWLLGFVEISVDPGAGRKNKSGR